jgi:tetratricopeptide (TPR) repeat protein
MDLKTQFSALFGKGDRYQDDYKRFKKSLEHNPQDHGLKAQFINFCLLNRFTRHESSKKHITEALALFETIDPKQSFDLQCHYLVGKYFQEERNFRKAYQVYLGAIKLFNRFIGMNPNLKSDNAELAYSMALNVMTLQSHPIDPEIATCFKILRKSYPLHLKRIELDNELAKPAPDKARIQELKEKIQKLKDDEELIASVTTTEKRERPVEPLPQEEEKKKTEPEVNAQHASKVSSHGRKKKEEGNPEITAEESENLDFLKLSPYFQPAKQASAFMVYQGDQWEGPYTASLLKEKGILNHDTWVCREGGQHVTQAYEVPDLAQLLQEKT